MRGRSWQGGRAFLPAAGRGIAVLLLLIAPMHAARAQTDFRDHVTAYSSAFFAAQQPSSALEMVNLLPGFTLVEGDTNVRGYSGAIGNVLIDGRPPASKQDKLSDTLKRITSNSVDHVELMRPGVAGIDMQGYALLANVVRKVSTAPRIRLETEYMQYPHGKSAPKWAGEISLGKTYVLDLQGSIYRDILVPFGYGSKNRYRPDGGPLQLASYDHPKYQDTWLLQGTYRMPLLGGNFRVNGLVNDSRAIGLIGEQDFYPVRTFSCGGEREMRSNNEFGVQYTHPLWGGAEVEVIGIRRSTNLHLAQGVTAAGSIGNQTIKVTSTDETISRSVLRQKLDAWNFEMGVEGALNGMNNRIAWRNQGVLVPLPSANVKLYEIRGEGFLKATWHVLPELTLEAGSRYEMSQLKQKGDTVRTRKLSYLKPSALVTWEFAATDEVRLGYERQAGQLDFNNFVSTVNLSQGQVSSGNPNLRPYTLWQTELAWEHRFSPGSLTLTARDQRISDTYDRIMLSSAAGLLDALGNVGGGKRREFQANFNMPLDWANSALSGVTIQGSWLRRFSSVMDPLTGEERRISGDNGTEGKIAITKDVPAARMRYGLTYTHAVDKPNWRFNEFMRNLNPEFIDAFVEYKPAPDWQIRLIGENLTDRSISRIRDVYAGPRNSAAKNYIEFNPEDTGLRVGLNIQHTLGQ